MRIAIVVPGRFHAFELTGALRARGHDAVVFTNYPRWAARRFGLPSQALRSIWIHGVLFRVLWAAHDRWGVPFPERWLNHFFGAHVAAALALEHWDAIHVWSAVAEEVLTAYRDTDVPIYVMRGSAHIRVQAQLLEDEERRVGVSLDRPSAWVIAREEREYALAQHIIVLSSFAQKTFLTSSVPGRKLHCLEIAAPVARFRPSLEVLEARCKRVSSGVPLRLLYVGALSYQKGLFDLAALIECLPADRFQWDLVGPAYREAHPLIQQLAKRARISGHRPERLLPDSYSAGDVFIYPTLQDGYAVVLAQAAAAALPIVASENCAAPDLAKGSPAIWTLPIRSPRAFVERLLWCDQHRFELAALIRRSYDNARQRTWTDVAADFEALLQAERKQVVL